MKRCLKEEKILNDGDPSIKIKYGEKEFLNAVQLISDDILKRFPNKNYGLLGVARGALPLLVAVSHRIDIRRVDVVQIQMTNSDNKWDYGTAAIVNDTLDDEINDYIVFEDIVSHGRSVNLLVNELKKKGKNVIAIYSLVLNEDMKKLSLDQEDMDIVYVDMIQPTQWVYFFWEQGY